MISREIAFELLTSYVKNKNMLNHCLASEAVMRGLARRLSEDEESWGLAGLLHDLDVEVVNGDMSIHGQKTAEFLSSYDVPENVVDAIQMHNESSSGKKRFSRFQFALAAGETITGLIVATTLVYPDKKLSSVNPKSVLKRMKEQKFAESVRRENIMECEQIGIALPEFVNICLHAMMEISDELGL